MLDIIGEFCKYGTCEVFFFSVVSILLLNPKKWNEKAPALSTMGTIQLPHHLCHWRAPVYSHQRNILAAAQASDRSLLSHMTTEFFFSWRRDGCFIPWIHFLITDAETKTVVWGATQRFMGLTHQPGADPALIKVSAAQRSHLCVWSLQQENTTTTFPPCQS